MFLYYDIGANLIVEDVVLATNGYFIIEIMDSRVEIFNDKINIVIDEESIAIFIGETAIENKDYFTLLITELFPDGVYEGRFTADVCKRLAEEIQQYYDYILIVSKNYRRVDMKRAN